MIIIDTIPNGVMVDEIPQGLFKKVTRKVKRALGIKPKSVKMTDYQKKTMERYKDAYKAVYGVPPQIHFDGTYFRVHGQTAGVNRIRLQEMARQLEFRKG